tara:strand:- start:1749 stop:2174 length:426 start_codon:yes stop_codon:yes gene_type:complete
MACNCDPMTELEKIKIGYDVMKNSYKLQVEKLKETIEELEFSLGGMTCDRDKHEEEADKLYEENEELKEENSSMNVVKWANDFRDLKEENKKLQEYLDKSREVSNRLIAENNTTMPSQSALYRENKKLKEELRDLKLSLID